MTNENDTENKTTGDSERKRHDLFFRSVFAEPKRTAELLTLAGKSNASLAEFLGTVDLSTLKEIPEAFSDTESSGNADLAFSVKVRGCEGDAELFVGVIEEHKSSKDDGVIAQLVRYWFQIMVKKQANVPTVAVIIYNGKDSWDPLSRPMFPEYPEYYRKIGLPFICEFVSVTGACGDEDIRRVSPQTAIALIALKYVFQAEELKKHLPEAIRNLKAIPEAERNRLIYETFVYLRESLPKEEKEKIEMDLISTREAYGYETIADAERAEGAKDAKREMAKAMLADRVPIDRIVSYSGLSEDEIKSL